MSFKEKKSTPDKQDTESIVILLNRVHIKDYGVVTLSRNMSVKRRDKIFHESPNELSFYTIIYIILNTSNLV